MSWAEAPDPAASYARDLLASHGIHAEVTDGAEPRGLAADWADSGAMHLTGPPDGPPRLVEGAPATTMSGALTALAALAKTGGLDPSALPDSRVLSERAAYMSLQRRGRISAGGATRLLEAADGDVALTLSRPHDIEALPALTGGKVSAADPWPSLAEWLAQMPASDVVERGALLGLAVGLVETALPPAGPAPGKPLVRPAPPAVPLTVVDLSALWAGPMCSHLLGLLGARVVVVESTRRPDPTRTVAPRFHRLLRRGAEHVELDLTDRQGVAALTELLGGADIVVESTRPRALHQLGVYPAEIVAAAKACSWVSITAYGRAHNRIGYGDDVAASAGLLGTGSVFAGDAIADPLTGAHAAVAALAGALTGASAVQDIAMYDVARAARTPAPGATIVQLADDWYVDDGHDLTTVRRPGPRPAT